MTTTLLAGLHDREGAHLVPAGGWCVDTVAIAESPTAPDYDRLGPGVNWIARLNFGYGAQGTLPPPSRTEEFAARCAQYVAGSRGCHRWVIGNEPNLPREWPDEQPISPTAYAACLRRVRAAIRGLPGHAQDEVLVAGPGPWNAEFRWDTNPTGDWVVYLRQTLAALGDAYEGVALHGYTHGYDPALVTSEARMAPPFADRRFEFRGLLDLLAVIPAGKARYVTEANGDGPWQARGLMPAMLAEVAAWNRAGAGVRCVVFYRYPDYDEYGMAAKPAVLAEFAAAAREYGAPGDSSSPAVQPDGGFSSFLPVVVAGVGGQPAAPAIPSPGLPARSWDERLTRRGVTLNENPPKPGDRYWRLVRAEFRDEGQAQGKHHIYVDVLDEQGARLTGVGVRVAWAGGATIVATEAKPGEDAAANVPLYAAGHGYLCHVADGQSDVVSGMGLGSIEQPDYRIHVAYRLVFQRVVVPAAQPAPATPPPAPAPTPAPTLVHPLPEARWRLVTQPFGVNAERYARFGLDGHNGVDFGAPEGTAVVAVDAGRVAEVWNDAAGYGLYVKLVHAWGESLYAHLSLAEVAVGQTVAAGQPVGQSGNTGFSTGPHLHFGLRVNPYTRGRPFDGYVDPLPLLGAPHMPTGPHTPARVEVSEAIRAAATAFRVRPALLAALAWEESRFDPAAQSKAGAQGLCQVMPATWAEWAEWVGATDPLAAADSARVGAAYLAWLIVQLGTEERALVAYNWGIGRVLAGKQPPRETVLYAQRVLNGAALLEAWGAG
jgi:hypothetical protein